MAEPLFQPTLQGPQAAGATPLAPVSNRIDLSPIGDIVNIFAKGLANSRKEEAEALQRQIIGDYTQENAKLDSAILQGAIKPTEAQTRRQALFAKFSANYPEFIQEFGKVAKEFKEVGAVGEAIDEVSQARTQRRNLINEAASKAGIPVSLSDPEDVQNAAIGLYQEQVRADEVLRRRQAQLTFEKGMNEEQRTAFKFKTENETNSLLGSLGRSHFDLFSSRVEQALSGIRSGQDVTQIKAAMFEQLNSIKAQGESLSRLNPGMYNSFIKVYEDMYKAVEQAPADMSADYENMVKQRIAKRQLLIFDHNDELLNLVAVSRGAPSVGLDSRNLQVIDKALRWSQSTNPNPDMEVAADPAKQHAGFDLYKKWRAEADKLNDPAAQKEADNIANGMLKSYASVGNVSGMTSNQLDGFISFVASPEFKQLQVKGALDPQTVEDARMAHAQYYQRPVSLAIQEKLLNETFTPAARFGQQVTQAPGRPVNPLLTQPRPQQQNPVPYSEMVEFKMIGDVIVAQPKVVQGNPLDVRDSQRLAEDLKGVTKYLNNLVAAGANLDNYESKAQYWEEQKHVLLPKVYPNPDVYKAGGVYEIDGVKFKYTGGVPWQDERFWERVENGE